MCSMRAKQDLPLCLLFRLSITHLYTHSFLFLVELIFMATNLKVGDKAPDFILPDIDMKPRSLKEFLGKKVVLAFFVGAFTSVCTKEMCSFRDSMARLTDLKAQVVGVSVNDPFSNKGFAEKNMLSFPILSDYKREIVKQWGL